MTKDFLLQLKNRLEDMINESFECGSNNIYKLIDAYERVLGICEKYNVTERKTEKLECAMSETEKEMLRIEKEKKQRSIIQIDNEGVSLNFENDQIYIPKEFGENVKIANGSLILGKGCTIVCDECNKENNKINLSIHLNDDFEIDKFIKELTENIEKSLQQYKY